MSQYEIKTRSLQMSRIIIPKRGKGRPSRKKEVEYQSLLNDFCKAIVEINSRLDFKVSSRGWCYMLEQEAGILKSEFDAVQDVINDCRKAGLLPLNFVLEDSSRSFDCIESLDETTPEEEAESILESIQSWWQYYQPTSFWENQDYYLEMIVEKIDLKSLFEPICQKYNIPVANAKGWPDINMRANMMNRFKFWEEHGKIPVLLYCGDFDPAGLHISEEWKKMLNDLSRAVGWIPDNLIIERFGLNYDFILENKLSWIENLITGSGKDLASPRHEDHGKAYVQDYIKEYGIRKCEANALVIAPEAGRRLCEETIKSYLDLDLIDVFKNEVEAERLKVKAELQHLMQNQQF